MAHKYQDSTVLTTSNRTLSLPNSWGGSPISTYTVQVAGTFGASALVSFQVSNDGSTWVTPTDSLSNPTTINAAGELVCLTILGARFQNYRLNMTNGDGSTSITATVFGTTV